MHIDSIYYRAVWYIHYVNHCFLICFLRASETLQRIYLMAVIITPYTFRHFLIYQQLQMHMYAKHACIRNTVYVPSVQARNLKAHAIYNTVSAGMLCYMLCIARCANPTQQRSNTYILRMNESLLYKQAMAMSGVQTYIYSIT